MAGGRRLLLLGLALLAASCRAPNPDYMMDAAPCALGRQCVQAVAGSAYPVVCAENEDGQVALIRERCPTLGGCSRGLCVPPVGAAACQRQKDCGDAEVCVPLVDDSDAEGGPKLGSYCLRAQSGALSPGSPCERDEDCASFLCLQHRGGSFCMDACSDAKDCGIPKECLTLNITLTGVQGEVKSCSPTRVR